MAQSSIEWTNSTWNPMAGCSCASAGCLNCYAMAMASRLEAMGQEKYFGLTEKNEAGKTVWTGKINVDESCLERPLEWKKPQMIFVNSMSDLFHENAPKEAIAKIWDVMRRAHWHTFQALTKRPLFMLEVIKELHLPALPNVWLGTSIENSAAASRIDFIRKAPAPVRFISFEPLIASVGSIDLSGIDWVIVGGESGPGARPLKKEWVDEIFETSRKYCVPFFFKQWGGVQKKKNGRVYNGKEWDEMPSVELFSPAGTGSA